MLHINELKSEVIHELIFGLLCVNFHGIGIMAWRFIPLSSF